MRPDALQVCKEQGFSHMHKTWSRHTPTKYKRGDLTLAVKGKGHRKRKSGDFQKAVKRALEVYNLSASEAATTFHQPHSPTVIRAAVQKLETVVFNWGWVPPFPPSSSAVPLRKRICFSMHRWQVTFRKPCLCKTF